MTTLWSDSISEAEHESYVSSRFDALHHQFKDIVRDDDPRLQAILRVLAPIEGKLILDLGCGKGRFARRFQDNGARVVGVDPSAAMLKSAVQSIPTRARAMARHLPFRDASFDAVVAVEVFEHLPSIERALDEAYRVLRPGGRIVILDKNAGSWNSKRPWLPNLIVKWIDERRGLWMYPLSAPVRERWFWPSQLAQQVSRRFEKTTIHYLLSEEEAGAMLFRRLPSARRMTLWTAQVPGGPDE